MFWSSESEKQNLEKKYKALMEESHRLSKIDREKSDQKFVEAEKIRKQLDEMSDESE